MATIENAFMIGSIPDAIIAALAAKSDLAEVQLFIDGITPTPVPQDRTPYAEVVVGEEIPVDSATGGLTHQSYTGLIIYTTQQTKTAQADWLDAVEGDVRRARVGSFDLIKRLLMITQAELQRAIYNDLDGLISTITLAGKTVREVVTAFRLQGAITYGLDDRTNNYKNVGSIGFVVETERTVE